MNQHYEKYTDNDQEIWNLLFSRQFENLKDKASADYLAALEKMAPVLNVKAIPNFKDIDAWFESETQWTIACVPGLIPVEDFFELLSKKQFCSSTWLRSMKNLDYLEEPDMFHDIFGHVPLLSNPVFSKFLHEFGKLGVAVKDDAEKLVQLQRLYWFTIEFGLIKESTAKIYGAGIASSFGETNLSVGPTVATSPFDLETILNQPFETDHVQNHYFVIDSYEQLFDAIVFLKKEWNDSKAIAC
ncbi:MAG: phenylalanine 4-monooxygenase [Bacteroidota bacterium]